MLVDVSALKNKQVFGKEQGSITDEERTRAKVVCLGIIYGGSAPSALMLLFFVSAWLSILMLVTTTLPSLLRSTAVLLKELLNVARELPKGCCFFRLPRAMLPD